MYKLDKLLINKLHIKMLDIQVTFMKRRGKVLSLYHSINNIVLFPNKIKGN